MKEALSVIFDNVYIIAQKENFKVLMLSSPPDVLYEIKIFCSLFMSDIVCPQNKKQTFIIIIHLLPFIEKFITVMSISKTVYTF